MPTDEIRLAAVLADAEAERAAELDALSALNDEEIAYLDQVGTLDDPETDDLECSGGV